MRILIDTNIFIYREDYKRVPESLQELLKSLNSLEGVTVLLHPLSTKEIERDKDNERKTIISSKIQTYPLLRHPPSPEKDHHFLSRIPQSDNLHEKVDDNLIYCVYKDAVDFLITEDKGIHKKSNTINLSQRILSIHEALDFFQGFIEKQIEEPPALVTKPVHNLDLNDPIFDTLKKDYPEFNEWWGKISKEGRDALVYYKDVDKLGAILIQKIEDEAVESIPLLPKKRRIKICTLTVLYTGYKIGELFIKKAVEYALKNNITEIYLTHFTEKDDPLKSLIEEYGFKITAKKKTGEDVYVKELLAPNATLSPIEIAKNFYPSFYDGSKVKKFILPIKPQFHFRLFPEYKGKMLLLFKEDELITEGNTIKKAYLSHSKSKKLSIGDILLFYKSEKEQCVTTIGVIDDVRFGINDSDELTRYIGKRTVYSKEEIEEFSKKPTTFILFLWNFNFKEPVALKEMIKYNILIKAPMSISELNHEKYLLIKKIGELDERFTVH